MTRPAIHGRAGRWPFTGYFSGQLSDSESRVDWAGRVTNGDDPVLGWRASRVVHKALASGGMPTGDRRRALSVLWTRLDGVRRDGLGLAQGRDLSLLLVARDPDGIAVSGVGLGAVHAGGGNGPAQPWVHPPHPLLGPAGFPAKRPGALTLDAGPTWLIAVAANQPLDLAGVDLAPLLKMCGVRR